MGEGDVIRDARYSLCDHPALFEAYEPRIFACVARNPRWSLPQRLARAIDYYRLQVRKEPRVVTVRSADVAMYGQTRQGRSLIIRGVDDLPEGWFEFER